MDPTSDPAAASTGPGSGPAFGGRRDGGRTRLALLGAAAVAVIGVAALAGTAMSSAGASPTPTPACAPDSPKLTVQGSGTATGTPDILTVDVDVSTTGPTAAASLADNNARTAAVIAAFTAGGVAKSDIQTTNVSVQPNYTESNGAETLNGYAVDDTVTATLSDLSAAGGTLDAVSAAAGDAGRINSVSFSLRDPHALEDQARSHAVQQAVSHARAMASSAGQRLGPVCSLTDATPSATPLQPYNAASGAVAPAPSSVPLAAGSQKVEAQVTLVYGLDAGSTGS